MRKVWVVLDLQVVAGGGGHWERIASTVLAPLEPLRDEICYPSTGLPCFATPNSMPFY